MSLKPILFICSLFVSQLLYAQSEQSPGPEERRGNAIYISVSKFKNELAEEFYDQAELMERKGAYTEALNYYNKAALEFSLIKNNTRYGQSLMRITVMQTQLKRYQEAEQTLLNVAIKHYSKMSSKPGIMGIYQQLANTYLAWNKTTQSMWFYSQQGILAQQLKNNNAYIESILGIAQVKIRKKEYQLANLDINRAEVLANTYKQDQFRLKIKEARDLMSSGK